VGLVLVDECELYAAPQWEGILRHYGCMSLDGDSRGSDIRYVTPALGFTATLERGDGQGLGRIWQNVCFSRDISWGVRKGYLVQPVGHRLEIDVSNPAESWPVGRTGSFLDSLSGQDEQLIESLAPERIVEKWREIAEDRPTIAFMPLVRSSVVLVTAFEDAGVPAAVIHGEMPTAERRWKLDAYTSGRIQVLVNAMVLTRGFDAPHTSCVIIGRPTKSRSLGIQMAGRGLRPVPGIPVEEQDCLLIYVQDATTDLFTHADLSDKPLDRRAEGALTAIEDEWDIGQGIEDAERHWTGKVDVTQFDPLVTRSSKVWRKTKGGTFFLPISKQQEYVFVVGTSVFAYQDASKLGYVRGQMRIVRLHKDLPDLDFALSVAEDEAQERGGDLGKLLADRNRPWRKQVPSGEMLARARQLGVGAEVDRIMADRAGGKAGKVSDLMARVIASRAIDPMVERIKEKVGSTWNLD
jgi:hypothetical protein